MADNDVDFLGPYPDRSPAGLKWIVGYHRGAVRLLAEITASDVVAIRGAADATAHAAAVSSAVGSNFVQSIPSADRASWFALGLLAAQDEQGL